MSVTAYRITRTEFVATAFTGEGAFRFGGRWNAPGNRLVYLAGSRSLATLEIMVHTEDISTIQENYSIIPASIPNEIIEEVAESDLPLYWNSLQLTAGLQIYGDRWVRESRSAVLCVPTAVTNEEKNYLLNPAHPHFPQIVICNHQPFHLNPRLIKA